MKIGFAQINPTVGDLSGNFEKIISAYERLAAAGAELVLTPELAITGYPPQDLVFKSRFVPENLKVLEQLHARVGKVPLLVGFVDRNNGRGKPFHNAAALLEAGKPIRKAHKSLLPTYDVFDEDRYFEPAAHVEPFDLCGKKLGVTICEDIWTEHYLPRPFYDVEPVRGLVSVRETEKLEGETLTLEAMRRHYLNMESWSQLVYDDLVAGAPARAEHSPLVVSLDPAP